MKFSYFLFLVAIPAVTVVYWYQATAYVCPAPLEYRLGDIDFAFELSDEEVLAHIAEAERVWELPANRELFVYNEHAKLPVNFIFDERQEFANTEEETRVDLDYRYSESEMIRLSIEKLTSEYDSLIDLYNGQVAAYEDRLNKYNQEVSKHNDNGGALPEVYENLESEREELEESLAVLTETEGKINILAKEINELSDKGNALISTYNEEVNDYNSEYGQSREFTQGDYQGDSVNIYKFSSDNELHKVLAHELGHALGIGHVEGTSSLMYYLLGDTSKDPVLSVEDMDVYYEVCGVSETFSQKMRRIIRNLIN